MLLINRTNHDDIIRTIQEAHEDHLSFVKVVKLNKYLDRLEHGCVLSAPTTIL